MKVQCICFICLNKFNADVEHILELGTICEKCINECSGRSEYMLGSSLEVKK